MRLDGIVSFLNYKNIEEAAKVYNRGLEMQIPKGFSTLEETIEHLKRLNVFVYTEKNRIKGLVSFHIKENDLFIDFICAIEPGKGIGKTLMRFLSEYALKNKISTIYSTVSSLDKRAISFYRSCGFKIFSKKKMRENFFIYRIKTTPLEIKK